MPSPNLSSNDSSLLPSSTENARSFAELRLLDLENEILRLQRELHRVRDSEAIRLSQLESQLNQANQTLTALNSELADRDQTITRLSEQLAATPTRSAFQKLKRQFILLRSTHTNDLDSAAANDAPHSDPNNDEDMSFNQAEQLILAENRKMQESITQLNVSSAPVPFPQILIPIPIFVSNE